MHVCFCFFVFDSILWVSHISASTIVFVGGTTLIYGTIDSLRGYLKVEIEVNAVFQILLLILLETENRVTKLKINYGKVLLGQEVIFYIALVTDTSINKIQNRN